MAGTAPTRLALLAAILSLAAGCTRLLPPVDAAPPGAATVHDGWPGCESLGAFEDRWDPGNQTPGRGTVPAGFAPTAALLCEYGDRVTANGDRRRVGLERRSTNLGELLTYLARPSQVSRDPATQGCPAMGWSRPYLFLLDADGRWVSPAVPTDACGFALDLLTDQGPVYQRLDYTSSVVATFEVTETAAARRSGCATAWKDVVASEAASGRVRPGRVPEQALPAGRLLVCRYTVATDEVGRDDASGDFVSGRTLSLDRSRALRRAISSAPGADDGCSRATGEFLLLRATTGGGATVYLEVGGCRRLLLSDDDAVLVVQDNGTLADFLHDV